AHQALCQLLPGSRPGPMSFSSLPAGIRLYDAHLHLYDPCLQAAMEGGNFGQVPNLSAQLVNGTHPDDWPLVAALQEPGPARILRAYGVHPWKVSSLPEDWERQLRNFLESGAASVGEIGLDNWVEPRDERRQMEVFESQLQMASELGLPPTLHCLRAWGLLIDTLRRGPDLKRGFLVHGFGGSVEVMHQLLDRGGYFSFSAYAADPGRKRMRDAARACPPDRLLVETDAPDMVPPEAVCRYPLNDSAGHRLHHPAEIQTAYAFLAEWRGVDLAELAGQVETNFQRLFL
ncbi:MAG TPA: TatD family hydrolase, partial [Oceanipulchritudo sp.]|nr:TatD family hydrolase [Oceanipulchritudo sp.]